jgi:protein-S-isoprenylcysteine O-methyltransferase Ste14
LSLILAGKRPARKAGSQTAAVTLEFDQRARREAMQKILLLVISLGATGLYLGLGVWGEGGFAAFFSHAPLIVVAVLTLAQAMVAPFTSGNLSSGVREDRENRWVLIAFGLIGLLTGFVPGWSDRTGFWTIDGDGARWIGAAVFTAGSVLRLTPVLVLGHRFSGLVAIQPGHRLVTGGIFGLVRNPSYVGLLVQTFGWGVAFNSWAGALITLLVVPPLIARINSEERLLASHFGAAYEAYRDRTWRLVPWLY